MNKEDILKASRKDHQNKDLPEQNITMQAGSVAGRVGALVCCLLSLIGFWTIDTLLYSPWIIYFSILGTHWLVRFLKAKRKTDLILSIVLLALAVLAFLFFLLRLLGERV